jgi:nicotinamide-nucleotide amidase
VDPAIIEKHGAVSREVVMQMAEGIRQGLGADFAVATSGIAGPDGGTEEKPVGTTWIAVASGDTTIAEVYRMGNHRGRNIRKASLEGLNLLRNLIINSKF